MTRNEQILNELKEHGMEVVIEKINGSSTTSKITINGNVVLPSGVVPRVQGFLEGLITAVNLLSKS